MSFDIYFFPSRGHWIDRPLPSDNAAESKFEYIPLDDADVQRVLVLLERSAIRKDDGFWLLELDDGGIAEVFGDESVGVSMVALRGLTPGIVQFLFDLIHAAGLVMLPVMEDELVAFKSEKTRVEGLTDDFPPIVVCHSADDLREILVRGYSAWREFRDRACGPSP